MLLLLACAPNAIQTGDSLPNGDSVPTAEGATRIYATVVSHNEEDSNPNCKDGLNNDPALYASNRALLQRLAEGIVARGAAYDQQNEWTYLSRVADSSYETPALKAQTRGQNIIAYLAGLDAQQISVDVHHHPSRFSTENHADIAGRLAELGVAEKGVVGGFIFSPAENSEVEEMQGYAVDGLLSTKSWGGKKPTWYPRILWGASSANHLEDSAASGIWRPAGNDCFYEDDPDAPLPNVGHYQGNLDFTGLADLRSQVEAGTLPDGTMLTATLMVNQCEMTSDSVDALLAEIDGYADAVAAGTVVWKTIPAIVEEWQRVYGGTPQV